MKERILIVDDQEDIRVLIELYLNMEGFQTLLAVDGEDGYNKFLSFKPDLVISDVVMPKLDGYGFLKKIDDLKDVKVPFVFMSAYGGGDENKFKESPNFTLFLRKPLVCQTICEEIKRILNNKKNR